ncbi:MAG: UMP kinase [Proteobacteria bacterium]|nr:UMP kinase [Pseudomonadota bacterium]
MQQYKRVMIKLSGESLMGHQKFGHDIDVISRICLDIKEVYDAGFQISIVIGGGNICRGATTSALGMNRVSADNMGMLATVINAIALQSSLERIGAVTRVQSATPMIAIAEQYMRRRAIRHMEKSRIVIFAAGTGNPFFTTDTAASLRASEVNCDVILKATQVDGIYSADPHINKNAVKYPSISYHDVITKNLGVMDITAITLARDNKIPILVFSIKKKGEILKVLSGKGDFSMIQ